MAFPVRGEGGVGGWWPPKWTNFGRSSGRPPASSTWASSADLYSRGLAECGGWLLLCPGDGNVGLEFECEEFEAEPELLGKKAARLVWASRWAPSPSAAKTSVIGGSRFAVCVAGTW